MKRDKQYHVFGNILSTLAGFSPEILNSGFDGRMDRAEFSAKARGQKFEVVEEEESIIPEEFHFFIR